MEARKRGVIIRPLGDVIVLMPPLGISKKEIDLLCEAVYDSIRIVTEKK
jgi:adenosylmethionine-8-amino-7-oxononanoate aminotransferase